MFVYDYTINKVKEQGAFAVFMQGAALVQAADEGERNGGKGEKPFVPPAAEGGRVAGFAVHAQQRHALRGKIPLRRVQQCVDQPVAAVFRTGSLLQPMCREAGF